MSTAAYFESVEITWALWLIALVSVAVLTRRVYHQLKSWNPYRLMRDEDGSSYSLSILLIVPFYAFLLALVVETTLLLTAKIGTTYSAYSAARAAVVWLPTDIPEASKTGMIRMAAINAIAPFASGRDVHEQTSSDAYATAYFKNYQELSGGKAGQDYLERKWKYAAAATQIAIDEESDTFNTPVKVAVEYEVPIHTPGLGRLLGTASGLGPFYTRKIVSTATLELEGHKMPSEWMNSSSASSSNSVTGTRPTAAVTLVSYQPARRVQSGSAMQTEISAVPYGPSILATNQNGVTLVADRGRRVDSGRRGQLGLKYYQDYKIRSKEGVIIPPDTNEGDSEEADDQDSESNGSGDSDGGDADGDREGSDKQGNDQDGNGTKDDDGSDDDDGTDCCGGGDGGTDTGNGSGSGELGNKGSGSESEGPSESFCKKLPGGTGKPTFTFEDQEELKGTFEIVDADKKHWTVKDGKLVVTFPASGKKVEIPVIVVTGAKGLGAATTEIEDVDKPETWAIYLNGKGYWGQKWDKAALANEVQHILDTAQTGSKANSGAEYLWYEIRSDEASLNTVGKEKFSDRRKQQMEKAKKMIENRDYAGARRLAETRAAGRYGGRPYIYTALAIECRKSSAHGGQSSESAKPNSDPGKSFAERFAKNASDSVDQTVWAVSKNHKHGGPGTNKCNFFIHEKLKQSGVDIGVRKRNTVKCRLGIRSHDRCHTPPTTTEWRKSSKRPSGFKEVPIEEARPGDIHLIDRGADRSGHIGVVVGRNKRGEIVTVSAGKEKVVRKVPTVKRGEKVIILRYQEPVQ